jgi:protein SDA1
MLFTMVERGMTGEVVGDKGKLRAPGPTSDTKLYDGEEAMWAIILTKELWKKGIWSVLSSDPLLFN